MTSIKSVFMSVLFIFASVTLDGAFSDSIKSKYKAFKFKIITQLNKILRVILNFLCNKVIAIVFEISSFIAPTAFIERSPIML